MDDEDGKSYRWETEYEKTWEVIKEDDHGRIQSSVDEMLYKAIRKRTLNKKNVRLGLVSLIEQLIDRLLTIRLSLLDATSSHHHRYVIGNESN